MISPLLAATVLAPGCRREDDPGAWLAVAFAWAVSLFHDALRGVSDAAALVAPVLAAGLVLLKIDAAVRKRRAATALSTARVSPAAEAAAVKPRRATKNAHRKRKKPNGPRTRVR